jgi:hypothetical protein
VRFVIINSQSLSIARAEQSVKDQDDLHRISAEEVVAQGDIQGKIKNIAAESAAGAEKYPG